ncbi:uncharacterized protein JCM15063_001623 [Sporobolomyces koalae]|uniref:uncharacterized protein n=1 Tax=Sporobolomyces koalae TaxID=500713 RepID=UPI00317C5EE9
MNPLSGSNRVPLSPRRTSSFLPSTSTVSSSATTTTTKTYTPSFAVPAYLRHSSLYAQFRTTRSHDDQRDVRLDRDEDHTILLPTSWEETDKCALLELSSDHLVASFAGSAKYGDRDAAAVRANRPVPPETGVYYFEVEILNKGVSGYIGIGLSHRSVSLSRLPGWESLSYGYHADDGRAFCSQGTGETFGPTFTTGDVVGCGIDWTDAGGEKGRRERDGSKKGKEKSRERGSGRVFYTKNGVFLGYAFSNLSGQLYPTIGLRTPNESVRVNFGQKPFQFDIESLVLDRQRTILSRISNIASLPPHYYLPLSQTPSPRIPILANPVPPYSTTASSERDRLHETLQNLIGGYLRHRGYDGTANAFEQQVKRERIDRAEGILHDEPRLATTTATDADVINPAEGADEKETSAALRSKILALATHGQTRQALELVQEHFPQVLEPGPENPEAARLVFELNCRVFVEAVLSYSRSENNSNLDVKGKGKADPHDEVDESQDDVDMSAEPAPVSPSPTVTIDELLDLGRSLHSRYSHDPSSEVQLELQATLGLMAYRDPVREAAEGRARQIVQGQDKDKVVEKLNRAILQASGLPPLPTLELLFKHAMLTVDYAIELGSGGAALVDVRKTILGG